ncbi:restriction endonuclease subunit S [Crocosphaera chwakensis]|uniref:Type II restriction-modification enzyme n=1 Tax=Crocosphaera chwakensis CCY0110 TaxID=391612 RepID=A3INZ8_9CHRO|nr:restriction endonuclease subunit S [Crocosphaera chwakensis]EAZ91800.1 type II restriction-modification enzyme [Crocosphaera chwakensis CCY0110]
MIDQNNFKQVLLRLEFSNDGNILYKKFPGIDVTLKADFNTQQLIYPTDKGFTISGDFTTSFHQKENFVVFECVCRLFEKGYKPQHIELEPKWTVGHGASGGRADIMVKDNSGKSLLIIECKTAGKEFNDEWKKTLINGGQIFSYAKQAGSTKFIALYTSDFVDQKVSFDYYLITLKDNEKLLEEIADTEPLSYGKAKLLDKEDIYQAWKETYNQDFATKGIFEDDIPAYEIGKTKYSLADLTSISSNDIQGKYHQFATILRQHNVSGRENAFDKLVNLFLCKIVDETNNPDELRFYWKGIAYDSFFELQDRLQKLYQEGMKRFLGEDVTYIDNEAIDQAFRFFKNDPDATRDTIKKYFRQLKFFTNNDFAFIDVHNEKLFYQNGVVLLKLVQMLQDIRLKTEEENQFLGDMFEGFLDQGIKQSEGQFFTPIPIVKFILKSLPLEKIFAESKEIPLVIDYACGAGHFLNEYAQEIKLIVENHSKNDLEKYYQNIVGIEKEYRLSKVAKVSAFMYGQDEINIIYADSLATIPNIKENDYSILVANPPFSVKGFLETLEEKDRKKYQLIETIETKSYPNNNSIETFFIERAKQLLKPDGVMGIIVPSPILTKGKAKSTSKSTNIYVATRKILLKYFDIIAITEFGSGTFGKTGTNTVTLFLRRKPENPAPCDHFLNRVNTWFKGEDNKDQIFQDEYLIKNYCHHLEFNFEDYKTFLTGKINENFFNHDILKDYQKEFYKWTEIKKLKKSRAFKALSKEAKQEELDKRFMTYVQDIERDKLYYFVLASLNTQQVLIIKSPSKNTEMKEFLGYEWSGRKGSEGIKYLGNFKLDKIEGENEDEGIELLDKEDKRVLSNLANLANINTPLYDPQNNDNLEKINFLIKQNFLGETVDIPESLSRFVTSAFLVDMLDFSSPDFNKAISLTPNKKNITFNTKWNLYRLGDIVEVKIGGTPPRENSDYFKGDNLWVSISEMNGQIIIDTKEKITDQGVKDSNVKLIPKGTTLLSFKLSIGKTAIAGKDLYTNEAIAGLIPLDKNQVLDLFLFHIFNAKLINLENVGLNTFGKSLNSGFLKKDVKIPLPPLEIQEEIVKACQAIDEEFEKVETMIKKEKEKIEKLANQQYEMYPKYQLGNLSSMPQYGANEKAINGNKISDYRYIRITDINEDGSLNNDFKTAEKIEDKYILEDGDFLFARSGNTVGKTFLYQSQYGKAIFAGYLIRFKLMQDRILPKYLEIVTKSSIYKKWIEDVQTGSSQPNINGQIYSSLEIPLPELQKQQKIISEVDKCEVKIKESQTIINSIAKRKESVIYKYL